MSLNSVNTNMGAMVALQSLQSTQQQLSVAQKQVSTGFRVADSSDDGAAYAIAQGIRANVGALTSANQQLGNVQGLLSVTQSGLNNISNTMMSMRDLLVKLSDSSVQGNDRSNYEANYKEILKNVHRDLEDANYNGKTLIGDLGNATGFGSVNVARNETGATYGIGTFSGSALYGSISGTLGTSTAVQALLTSSGTFMSMQNKVNNQLNKVGSSINYISNQTTYNNDKINALNGGLGSLIDADLAKESAQLTALQIRQQLGTQALSMANQAPQSLLSLFK